jgi:hypothetical protein
MLPKPCQRLPHGRPNSGVFPGGIQHGCQGCCMWCRMPAEQRQRLPYVPRLIPQQCCHDSRLWCCVLSQRPQGPHCCEPHAGVRMCQELRHCSSTCCGVLPQPCQCLNGCDSDVLVLVRQPFCHDGGNMGGCMPPKVEQGAQGMVLEIHWHM